MTQYIVGFDPGGKGKFGWCIIPVNAFVGQGTPTDLDPKNVIGNESQNGSQSGTNLVKGGTVANATSAFTAIQNHLSASDSIVAVGIDAPLSYDGRNDRQIDIKLRNTWQTIQKSIMRVNSLRGACLAQGAVIAQLMTNHFKSTVISESHPRIIMEWLAIGPATGFCTKFHQTSDDWRQCDICCAGFAAYSAAAAYQAKNGSSWQNWTNHYQHQQNQYNVVPHDYWLPKNSSS